MGVLDKFLDAIKLNDDYDEEEFLDDDLLDEADDDDFLDDEAEDRPKKNFFQKFSRKKEEADDFDDFDEELDDPEPVKPAAKPVRTAAASKTASREEKQVRPSVSSKITPMRSSRRQNQSSNMEVCVIKPTSMEDSREIADTLVDNSTVILNLEGIDVEMAQRIIDFTSGACYSLGGSLQKVSSYIFVLGPSNVDITGDLQNILGGSAPSVRAGY
ncbi:cell division protein SepF [Blautia sp. HCP3S3_G3]|uniref:cell division protein SepF n=1 Tax=Blautia sp. HCP3S3_G3 TaxID=3438913 RepID=UPI003F8AA4F9